MIVCHCMGVSDRSIREAVRTGARNCRQVMRACEAGGRCGGCRPVIHEIIEREHRSRPSVALDELIATS